MFYDEKIVPMQGETNKYGLGVLNPDGSLVGGGTVGEGLYEQNIAYDTNGNAEYLGEASPGSAVDDEPNWRITKFTYDTNGNLTAKRYADNETTFDKVWDDRATYTY